MTWLQASSHSKPGPQPTQPNVRANGRSQPCHGHITTTVRIVHSHPQMHTSAPANMVPPRSPRYCHTTQTANRCNMSSTSMSKRTMTTASNLQSTKKAGMPSSSSSSTPSTLSNAPSNAPSRAPSTPQTHTPPPMCL